MDAGIKNIIRIVGVIIAVLVVLQAFGVIDDLPVGHQDPEFIQHSLKRVRLLDWDKVHARILVDLVDQDRVSAV